MHVFISHFLPGASILSRSNLTFPQFAAICTADALKRHERVNAFNLVVVSSQLRSELNTAFAAPLVSKLFYDLLPK